MKIKRKINLLPNVITSFGLCCGLFVIFKMTTTPPEAINRELLTLATVIVLLGAFADLLDGAIARVIKAESEFGSFFDSMADGITFGVAPAVIVLKSLAISPTSDLFYLVTTSAMVYAACGILRLVRFNVSSLRTVEAEALLEAKKTFTGLPIPAACAALISSNLFLVSDELKRVWELSPEARAWILFVQMLILGFFMVSRWKFLSLKTLRIRIRSFREVLLTVIFTVFIVFYGLMQHFSVVFVAVAWSYVVIAWIFAIVRMILGKKAAALQDFEPEPELEDEGESEGEDL